MIKVNAPMEPICNVRYMGPKKSKNSITGMNKRMCSIFLHLFNKIKTTIAINAWERTCQPKYAAPNDKSPSGIKKTATGKGKRRIGSLKLVEPYNANPARH